MTQTAIERRAITATPLERQKLEVEDLVRETGYSIPELALMVSDGGVAVGADNASLLQFLLTAKASGLDPRKRQCFYIKRGGHWTFTSAIYGFASIAERSGRLAGLDEPEFRGHISIKDGNRNIDVPEKAVVTVWKVVGPWEHPMTRPFRGTADWDEFYPGDGDVGRMWRKMPRRMLGKCATAQALRLAFPEQLAETALLEDETDQGRILDVAEVKPARTVQQNASEYDRVFGSPEQQSSPAPATLRRTRAQMKQRGLQLVPKARELGVEIPPAPGADSTDDEIEAWLSTLEQLVHAEEVRLLKLVGAEDDQPALELEG